MSRKTFLEKLADFFDSPFWQGFGSVLGIFPRGSYEESRKQYERYRRKFYVEQRKGKNKKHR